jgi:hypothetical protein
MGHPFITGKDTQSFNYITKIHLLIKSINPQAVDEKSGSLSGATNIVLEADHVGMNKFKSSEDNNYKYVLCEMATAVKGLRG